jgi:hypothetical protein
MYCSVLLFYLLLIDLAERDDIKKMVHALENLFFPLLTARNSYFKDKRLFTRFLKN